MAIVMGRDQQRAQITAEWIDTDTGEVSRARVAPALRPDVRRFVKRFAGQRPEVALEATTGWRFVVEELRAIGAGLSDEVCVVVVTDSALVAGKDTDDDQRHLWF